MSSALVDRLGEDVIVNARVLCRRAGRSRRALVDRKPKVKDNTRGKPKNMAKEEDIFV